MNLFVTSDTRFAIFETLLVFFDRQHRLRIHQKILDHSGIVWNRGRAHWRNWAWLGRTLCKLRPRKGRMPTPPYSLPSLFCFPCARGFIAQSLDPTNGWFDILWRLALLRELSSGSSHSPTHRNLRKRALARCAVRREYCGANIWP